MFSGGNPGDTVVSIVKDGESDPVILGKPGTVEKAEEMISLIQGRTHQVYTGVTVILCLGADRFAETTFAEKADVEVYEMAEYLQVTEEYLKEALECYNRKYGENLVTIDNYAIRFVPSLQVMEFWK